MLVIDDKMFKLARMQEALLKVSTSNREENLNNYKKTVTEIDVKAFGDILELIEHINEHNQSLEDELQFLEKIKSTYDQLLELQLNFKRICQMYGNTELTLSDLSKLNIEYIDSRINAINGYLVNLKNIDVNKKRLQDLNEQLVEEEKKRLTLSNKLLELENTLKNNFCSAEGRCVVDGNLVYTNIISEYEKIGLNLNALLSDTTLLSSLLAKIETEKKEVSEKVRVAEVCYNNMLTADSRQILNEINIEYLKIKYRLTMLKIVELLVQNNDDYDLFVKKRETLLDLIKYRLSCLEQLGMKVSIDPFGRIKVQEQLNTVLSLSDNTKIVANIRKEISQLNSRTEEMLGQNNSYLITLNDTRNLIESSIGFGDVDITSVVSFEELLVKQDVLDNQVVSVKNISAGLNMGIISQKTASVIKRVSQMMSGNHETKKTLIEEVVPELVIVPKTNNDMKQETTVSLTIPEARILGDTETKSSFATVEDTESEVFEDESEEEDTISFAVPETAVVEDTETELSDEVLEETELGEFVEEPADEDVSRTVDFDMFSNVIPFEAPTLFIDRTDSTVSRDGNIDNFALSSTESSPESILDNDGDSVGIPIGDYIIDDSSMEMPEAFWVTHGDDESQLEDDIDNKDSEDSFDAQINALLSLETQTNGPTRKKVA